MNEVRGAHTFELLDLECNVRASGGHTTMRRDAGCGERASRNVDGQQGHEAGGTIDSDGLRPPNESHAATSRMADTACEDRHPASGCVPSTWGRQAGVVFGGELVG